MLFGNARLAFRIILENLRKVVGNLRTESPLFLLFLFYPPYLIPGSFARRGLTLPRVAA